MMNILSEIRLANKQNIIFNANALTMKIEE